MRSDRIKKMRAVTPYNGYKIKDKNTSWVRGMNIYTPKYDTGRYHNVLCNMRHSLNYVQDDGNFRDKFKDHLEHTGFDAVPVIAVREWEKEQPRRKKKFGYAEDSIVDYPDKNIRGERLAKTRSHSSMHPALGDDVVDKGDSQWQYTHENGKPWDWKTSSKHLASATKIKDRSHLWNSSYNCRFRKNRSTDAYLVKRDNSVMPAAGMWSQYKRPSGVYRRHVARKVRDLTESQIMEGKMRENGGVPVKQNNFKINGQKGKKKNLRTSSSAYIRPRDVQGNYDQADLTGNPGGANEFQKREWRKRNQLLRKKINSMTKSTKNSQKVGKRGKYNGDIFKTVLDGPSKENVQKAIRMVRNRDKMSKKYKKYNFLRGIAK